MYQENFIPSFKFVYLNTLCRQFFHNFNFKKLLGNIVKPSLMKLADQLINDNDNDRALFPMKITINLEQCVDIQQQNEFSRNAKL